MLNLNGKVAAITGAGSGIGQALARVLAGHGCHLALSDVNEGGLTETAAMIDGRVRVTTRIVDVAKRDQVAAYAEGAATEHGGVDIIINNAGVAMGDFLETTPYEDFEWLMGINFWGVVYGTKEFLPYLRQRPWGHIVNISSMNGFLPNPTNGPYVASKFAVRGYTETLYQELRGSSVSVSVVHPGGIKTNIARNAKLNRPLIAGQTQEEVTRVYEEKMFKTTPEDAAGVIVDGIRKRKLRVLVGKDAKFLWVVNRCFPQGSIRLLNWLYRRMNRR